MVAEYSRNYFEMRYFDREGAYMASARRYGEGSYEVGRAAPSLFATTPGDSVIVAGVHGDRLTFPDSFPTFQDLHVDVAGRIWVLEYAPPSSEADFHWRVLAPTGELVAEVVMPFEVAGSYLRSRRHGQRHAVMHIGESSVPVWARDELGVHRIRRYPIVKPE